MDYVIVGGGPAGLVLLEQLTRDPNVNITLIEAGPDGSSNTALNSKSIFNLLTKEKSKNISYTNWGL